MNAKHFHMANRLEAVDPMVLQLRAEAETLLSGQALFNFEVCIIEALTNVVTHGWVGNETDGIDITLSVGAEHALVEILDHDGAPPFDLRKHAQDLDKVDAMAEGGRGLGLIVQCADKIEYLAKEGRNCLSLHFRNEAD